MNRYIVVATGFAVVAVVGAAPALATPHASTQVVSRSTHGDPLGGTSGMSAVSGNGRFIAFSSETDDSTDGDHNDADDVFVRDLATGTTRLVSAGMGGHQSDHSSGLASISADGQHVAFWSDADNLVAGDTDGVADVFVRDLAAGTTERVSVASDGAQADAPDVFSFDQEPPAISPDGRYVAFASPASTLVPGDTNRSSDIFVRDRVSHTTTLVDVTRTGGPLPRFRSSFTPTISADGRFVAFYSEDENLAAGTGCSVYVRDLVARTTVCGGVGQHGNVFDAGSPAISADGQHVGFWSWQADVVHGDTNGISDVFVRDLTAGTTTRASISATGAQMRRIPGISFSGQDLAISATGRYVAFDTIANWMAAGDHDDDVDVFVRDLTAGTTTLASVLGADNDVPSISADGRHVAYTSPLNVFVRNLR